MTASRGLNYGSKYVKDDFVDVQYSNEAVFVSVQRIMPDYEPRVKFGLRSGARQNGDPLFDVYEIMERFSISTAKSIRSDNDHWRHMLSIFCDVLIEHGAPALEGDEAFYQSLSDAREMRRKQFVAEEQNRNIRNRADDLWTQGDRLKAAKLYAQLTDASQVELKKIAVANRLERSGH